MGRTPLQQRADRFGEEVGVHLDVLYRVAVRWSRQAADAEDLVHEVLLRAWRSYSASRSAVASRAWLLKILRNVWIDRYRAARRADAAGQVAFDEADLVDLQASLPRLDFADEVAFREFLDDRVAAALEALPDSSREVVILSVVGELTYRQIAGVLDCPVGTVMSRIARAKRALRERLSDYAHQAGYLRGAKR